MQANQHPSLAASHQDQNPIRNDLRPSSDLNFILSRRNSKCEILIFPWVRQLEDELCVRRITYLPTNQQTSFVDVI